MTQNSTPSTGETTTPSTAEASYPLISVATVATDRAARYGKQLVSHMAHKITGSWDEDAGSGYLLFDREGPVLGRFDVIASASDLRLELRTEPERADRLEFIVGIHLRGANIIAQAHVGNALGNRLALRLCAAGDHNFVEDVTIFGDFDGGHRGNTAGADDENFSHCG